MTEQSHRTALSSLPLLGTVLTVAILGATFAYLILNPEIGFDDANITQAYAKHIAQGHGYVYNVGGERVEAKLIHTK